MGSGSKKGHEAFSVTPADTTAASLPSPAMEPVTAGDEGIFNQYVSDEEIAGIAGASSFTAMSAAVASAQGTLANADQQPAELQSPSWPPSRTRPSTPPARTGWTAKVKRS